MIALAGGPPGEPARRVRWWSEVAPPPRRARRADDRTRAAEALAIVRSGDALAWGGDWHNARQLLAAMARRIVAPRPRGPGLSAAFRAERELRRLEHELLSRLAVPVGPGWASALPRAPALGAALGEAFGAPPGEPVLMPLREILGAIGAHQWLLRGVPVPALGGAVHPRYGVFAPVRGEYVELVARALAEQVRGGLGGRRAFDVGTGTGVLAILLARAGAQVVATDVDPRAVTSARENAARFGVADRVEVVQVDLFPEGRARLVVANPPWIPEQPHGPLDRAVYDAGGELLGRLVAGLGARLEPDGEAWLVVSDLAERLGLRPPGALDALISSAGLRARFVLETRPAHPRAREGRDALSAARAAERTRLYGLVSAGARHATT